MDRSDKKYTVEKIKERILQIRLEVIPGCPTNCFIIQGIKRDYVVDTGFGTETAEIIKQFLSKDKNLLIINTHHHWDHIWGNCGFEDTDIIGHVGIVKRIEEKWDIALERNRRFVCGDVEKRIPNILFDSRVDFYDDGLFLFHSPGHTEEGISIFLKEERVLLAGDNIGDNEEEIIPCLESGEEKYREVLERYISLKPDMVLSGHNNPVGMGFLLKIREELNGKKKGDF